ncbi:hypothetical protein HZA98_00920 [Candidatus Woesearchaeota archaeon]|nr:hypothetical protein [Candidatus Woesearchaeota archaeon]
MKKLEIAAQEDSLDILKRYLKEGLTGQFKKDAEKIYLQYLSAEQLIHPELYAFIGWLFPLAYPYAAPVTGIPPTKEKVKELIKKLQEIKL